MAKVTFITGNQAKADFLADYLGLAVEHQKLDLDEIQSLDLSEISEHKARQAHSILNSPVLVEDVGLYIDCLGKLPGPFIKWFEQEISLDGICKLVGDDRGARAAISFAYYNGERLKIFNGEVPGSIARQPRGAEGFGWNPIFIPNGSNKTYAEMDEKETKQYSLRTTTVFPQIKSFLEGTYIDYKPK